MILSQFSLIDNPMKNFFAFFLTASISLTACSAYRPDLRQGNVLDSEQIKKLQVGMTQKQVSFILGNPLLLDPFHRTRWDYLYTLKKPDEPILQQHLILYFKNEILEKIDDSQLDAKSLSQ